MSPLLLLAANWMKRYECIRWLHAPPVQHASRKHYENLKDSNAGAQEHGSFELMNCSAGGIVEQYSRLSMALPFSSSVMTSLNSLQYRTFVLDWHI